MVDQIYRYPYQPQPSQEKIEKCKIVSHRGEHNNRDVLENTIQAFDRIKENNIWGIEFDVRWTRDLIPVVFHDKDTRRIFGNNITLSPIDYHDLIKLCPLIPSLEEVIQRYAEKLHLMVEIKHEHYPDPVLQKNRLKKLFSNLKPKIDYHLISLDPGMYQLVDFVPPSAFIPISEFNFESLSEISIRNRYGGIFGHYLFMTNNLVKRHHHNGQKVGTGYVKSRNSLFREINRNIEWVFSNHAVDIQAIRDSSLQ